MPRNAARLNETPRQLVGQAALHASLNLRVPPPAVTSYVAAIARRTEIDGHRVVETFPKRYSSGETPLDHLRFARRHEPLDLGVLAATFKALSPDDLAAWIRAEPTGAYSRRAWFFYERLTGKTLDTPSASAGNYADALDGDKQYVSRRRPSQRHRVNDNLPDCEHPARRHGFGRSLPDGTVTTEQLQPYKRGASDGPLALTIRLL